MKTLSVRREDLLFALFYLLFWCAFLPECYAVVDFFRSSEEKMSPIADPGRGESTGEKRATVLFFISEACGACPEEASKLQAELMRMGWKYEIEGIFVGSPTQVGKYLAELRGYPFNFELELDMDRTLAKKYGVKTFPTAVVEFNGKRIAITKASELSEKLR